MLKLRFEDRLKAEGEPDAPDTIDLGPFEWVALMEDRIVADEQNVAWFCPADNAWSTESRRGRDDCADLPHYERVLIVEVAS